MPDTYLIASVIVMLNEGIVDECACPECTEYKTTLATGIIKLVRDHDKPYTISQAPLPASYGTSPTGTTYTRPMRSNL